MTLADRTFPGAVRTRLPLVVLLCAVALGIVGMHGLASGPDSGEHVGHHAAPTIIMTTDTTVGVVASLGVVAGDEAPPADDGGLLALCLMMLTPGLALGLWLLAIAARGGGWRLPRLVPWVVAALDVAGLPPPFERQLTVLRI
ncbi:MULTISPECIES: hypothetical protein [Nocardioides]|jgi:hypothetical protein|uniref:Uncharacterized protein n=1 Tax=Nocardioides salarius TaxID=374513 RepID=A0ABS2MEM7_9ACTN|nr:MULTISPECIES: hypothetical protein [Nocardioides]MAS53890.1 hypothetical protein [Pimelobacter sp.]MBL4857658.1 hypothetical protein [Erythrobacter sp.]MBU2075938.1 hypothetical protein [Actinomycetota bacterium]MBM7509650.1 hypothetical protein [Nocardioides salarius]MCK5927126.1 hypothetical protein [Nocardioides sp.]